MPPLQGLGDRHRRPIGAGGVLVGPDIPDDDASGPVLTLGDPPLKVDVVEGVVLGGDGKPLRLGVEGGALGDRPGLEDAPDLEAEVVVEPLRPMLLDGIAGLSFRTRGAGARGLAGFGEVSFFAVGFEILNFGHV